MPRFKKFLQLQGTLHAFTGTCTCYVFETFLSCHFSNTVNMILSSYFDTFSCGFSINNITLCLMLSTFPEFRCVVGDGAEVVAFPRGDPGLHTGDGVL